MNLLYKRIRFIISFSEKTNFTKPVPFLFRSIIGFQLRKMCCIAHNNICADCMFNATCIYGLTFESVVPRNNAVLSGRNRVSHPIIIDTDNFEGKIMDSLVLNIIFLGQAIPYIPYFYYALKMGGESGITKERIQYKISDIIEFSNTLKERSIKKGEEQIDTHIEPELWEYNKSIEKDFNKCYNIVLISPLRYKAMGSYAGKFVDGEFAMCLHRRAQILCSQYGKNDFSGEYRFSGGWTVKDQNLKWRDFFYYSARQKKTMRLGGLTGDFKLSGKLSFYECSLLQFAELFHAGKNTNFGLGKMRIQEEKI